jgi:hypothetical protein
MYQAKSIERQHSKTTERMPLQRISTIPEFHLHTFHSVLCSDTAWLLHEQVKLYSLNALRRVTVY